MADETASFGYQMRMPDGSIVTRYGQAPRAPTLGELQSYVTSQGGTLVRPLEAPTAPPPMLARPPEELPPPAAPPPAPTPARGIGAELQETFLPRRTFTSQLPSIIGGTAGGTLGATVGGPFAPVVAGVGAAAGEAGQVGLEQVMGWPAAEPGTLGERMVRAGERGAAGEALVAPLRWGAQALGRLAPPAFKAAEQLGPVLTRDVPADTVLMHAPEGLQGAMRAVPVDEVLKSPVQALTGVTVTPEMQQTLLSRWWQTAAEGGPKRVVAEWDALKEAGQVAVGGDLAPAMGTVVDTLRRTGKPLYEMTRGELARSGLIGTALTYAGHPYLAAAAGAGEQLLTEQAPRLFLSPGPAGLIASLPYYARVASPWASGVARAGGQTVAQPGLWTRPPP